ncbi:MAG: exo-beta-N-acetylmuramidase NamZ domain-containing protein [Gemmatimonadales bacterium]
MTRHSISLGTLALLAACSGPDATRGGVRPGIEVLVSDSFHLLAGRRLGVLTNQTGVDRAGVSDVERLLSTGAQVTAIFSPEHGYRGVLNRDSIGHGTDSATGLPIYSLYGATREPTAQMLAGVDLLIIDLQDIGARPYTYISTTLMAMRAAKRHSVGVMVLDRPNPIGGVHVEGPVLDTAYRSFVGMLPIPLRHGMTLGELALLGDSLLGIDSAPVVIPVEGWSREQWFDQTSLPWVRPSPNMPDLESATHYPGLVLFEGTNLSVGRGTPVAFQVVGAPWLDPPGVSDLMGAQAGVSLGDTNITPVDPSDGKYGGITIPALRLRVTDRDLYRPTHVAVALLAAIRARHLSTLDFREERFDRLAGGSGVRQAILRGDPPATIVAGWEEGLRAFGAVRRRFLLYR